MAPRERDAATEPVNGATKQPASLAQSTLMSVSVPRHWLRFGMGYRARTVRFSDGSLVQDAHLRHLSRVQELELRECDYITSIQGLTSCTSLTLRSCDQVTAIRDLPQLQSLDISDSSSVYRIEDVPALTTLLLGNAKPSVLPSQVQTLSTSAAVYLAASASSPSTYASLALKQCHESIQNDVFAAEVHLTSCDAVTRLDAFRFASTMTLSRSRALEQTAFDALRLLQTIRLQASTCLTSVTALARCISVHLSLCVNLADVSPLRHCHSVELSCCPQVHDVNALSTVYDLALNRCADIESLDGLAHNHTLRVAECYRVSHVGHLHDLHTIELVRCHR
ncbi:hypothetical protein SPRG_06713 [Saprolegnia parasitica CBS 223.65]|uniref:Uncharacterized protein n=1 Tax=Saprolegnia parasitica (strain CBS 223.65) TaxID=695850 RepID=A0A067CCH3_SAPPC|nr:hypothetical protein SPRG_06713 [Saprolegnia parasitica CBS 223.65]KDO28474.1 hypothetical protein SPRG_06713 [Saprolegnia parasitica CBS 223.65]|eukprot:XP_012200913.1 hypothetical protein SPRG_06713 [Saprolegnia parasitica CBS 223.65]